MEESVDERRGDQHDGRHGRGGLMMWLNSEISGCVDGGSTYLDRDHHVDDENRSRRYEEEYDSKDEDRLDVWQKCTCMYDHFDGYGAQCQTGDDFPRSARRTPQICLYTNVRPINVHCPNKK